MLLSPRAALVTGLLAAAGLAPASAQIELGEEWLLGAGLDLDLGVDEDFSAAEVIGPGGADQTWSFASAVAADTVNVQTRPASEGRLADTFPTADFVFRADVGYGIAQPNTDVYMRRRDDDVVIVGVDDPLGTPAVPFVRLDDGFAFQSAPVVYQQVGDASTTLVRDLDGDLVAEISGSPLAATFDTIRVTVTQDVNYVVDAWGTLTLRGREYESLRIRSVTQVDQRIEASTPGSALTDITALAVSTDLLEGLGADTLVDYSWVVAGLPYPIAQVTLAGDGSVDQLRFALVDSVSSGVTDVLGGAELDFAVGVGAGVVALDFDGAPAGTLGRVDVYDAAGARLATRGPVALDAGGVTLPTGGWPAGIKLATVWVGRRVAGTRRFVTP